MPKTIVVLTSGTRFAVTSDIASVERALEGKARIALDTVNGGRLILSPDAVAAVTDDPEAITSAPVQLGKPPT